MELCRDQDQRTQGSMAVQSENILVSIRVRPLTNKEAAKGNPWKLTSKTITLNNTPKYTFDRVFDMNSKTSDIYNTHTKKLIASTVHGFNGTILAYGQTSSGKTFTMRGSQKEPGIIPLAIQDVFRNTKEESSREFLLRVSYMEIYNDEIKDLLTPGNYKLQVHESLEHGVFVAGIREEIVVSPEQVLELMEYGQGHRHIGETNMNVESTRSHTILRMVIESRERDHDGSPEGVQTSDPVRVSHLNLVDLAGSERFSKSGAEGTRLKEGTHINKSLMALGNVITKLSEGIEKQGGHIPYRDSKLTRILQTALGGNARTLIICNVAPALIHVNETRSTLHFASRAKRVTNCAQVNEILTDAALLKRQRTEIAELRQKLQNQEFPMEYFEEETLNLRSELLKTELQREDMVKELQEFQKEQAERERRIKEQEDKISNLCTMVINSAIHSCDEKHGQKGQRRVTWCPILQAADKLCEINESKAASEHVLTNKESVLDKMVERDSVLHLELPSLSGSLSGHDSKLYVADRSPQTAPRMVMVNEMERKNAGVDQESERESIHIQLSKNQAFEDTQHEKSLDGERKVMYVDGMINSPLPTEKLHCKVEKLDMEQLDLQHEVDRLLQLVGGHSYTARERTTLEEELAILKKHIQEIELEKVTLLKPNRDLQDGPMTKDQHAKQKYVQIASEEAGRLLLRLLTLELEVVDLSALLQVVRNEKSSLVSERLEEHAEFMKQLNAILEEKDALINTIAESDTQLLYFRATCAEALQEMENCKHHYQAELTQHHAELNTLHKLFMIAEDTSGMLTKDKNSLQKDLDMTKARLKEAQVTLAATLQEKEVITRDKYGLQKDLDIAIASLKEAQATLVATLQESEVIVRDKDSLQKDLDITNVRLKDALAKLKATLQESKVILRDKDSLQKDLDITNVGLKNALATLAETLQEGEVMMRDKNDIQKDLHRTKATLHEVQATLAATLQEGEVVMRDKEGLQNDLGSTKARLMEVQTNLAATLQEIEMMMKDKYKLQGDLDMTNARLKEALTTLAATLQEREQDKKQTERLLGRESTLEKEYERVKALLQVSVKRTQQLEINKDKEPEVINSFEVKPKFGVPTKEIEEYRMKQEMRRPQHKPGILHSNAKLPTRKKERLLFTGAVTISQEVTTAMSRKKDPERLDLTRSWQRVKSTKESTTAPFIDRTNKPGQWF